MQFAPLRQRNFALLWWAGLISIAGDWTLRVALPIWDAPFRRAGCESVAGLLGATLGGTLAGKLGVLNLLTIQGALPLLCGIGFAIFIRGRVADRHSPAVVSPEMATARESS